MIDQKQYQSEPQSPTPPQTHTGGQAQPLSPRETYAGVPNSDSGPTVASRATLETTTGEFAIREAAMREPRQERGQRRVDEILDAGEALILEVGVAACSIQELARRSGASVGSIYHFFPTKEAIFDALRERFAAGARELVNDMLTKPTDWAALDLRTFIERLTAPFIVWLEQNPAQFELAKIPPTQQQCRVSPTSSIFPGVLKIVFGRRWPTTPESELAIRADVCWAIGGGLVNLMLQAPPELRVRISQELSCAMYGYILGCETNHHTS